MSHTPGPWKVETFQETEWNSISACPFETEELKGASVIAKALGTRNSKLIAAAPEMLEMLKRCLHATDWPDHLEIEEMVRKASGDEA